MAHFAELDSNDKVLRVVRLDNTDIMADGQENEKKGSDWLAENLGGRWIKTSYNGNIRKQYAGPGYSYNAEADVFIGIQPYPSWTLNDDHEWEAPVSMPAPVEGKGYVWNESTLSWDQVDTIVIGE